MRINTNLASINAQQSLAKQTAASQSSMRKISTGSRITQASDDAAGLSISEGLKADIRGNRIAKRNAEDAGSFAQVAEGGLNEIGNILGRLKELSVQSASDTIGDKERQYIENEAQGLMGEIDRIAESTKFGGKSLLDGSAGRLEFQVGTDSSGASVISHDMGVDASSRGLDINGLSLDSAGGSRDALEVIDDALSSVGQMRSGLGALQNRLTSTVNNLDVSHENLSAANSRIRDVDMAEETAKFAQSQVLQQSATAMLAQANNSAASALSLL